MLILRMNFRVISVSKINPLKPLDGLYIITYHKKKKKNLSKNRFHPREKKKLYYRKLLLEKRYL